MCIRDRPCTDYRKFEFLINKKYKDYPNLINALMTRFDRYNEQCKRMKQLEEDKLYVLLKVKDFKMLRPVIPGDTLIISVNVTCLLYTSRFI